jgi:hypothetical protein
MRYVVTTFFDYFTERYNQSLSGLTYSYLLSYIFANDSDPPIGHNIPYCFLMRNTAFIIECNWKQNEKQSRKGHTKGQQYLYENFMLTLFQSKENAILKNMIVFILFLNKDHFKCLEYFLYK